MMELLGKIPRKVVPFTFCLSCRAVVLTSVISSFVYIPCLRSQVAIGGARSKDLFDRYGDLKRIRRLKYWSLDKLLIDKYKFSESDAREFADFLCPLLDFAPEKRPTAQQCLQHPWLNLSSSTQSATKKEANVEKLNVGISNLQVKVGK